MFTIYDRGTSIATFLDAAAARQPTPGGGSATALTGALAASMGEMVINYSLGKKGLEGYAGEFQLVLQQFQRGRQMLLELLTEDQAAFEALSVARKLPADAPGRDETFNVALLVCVRVPQAIATTAIFMMEQCDRIVDFVNIQLLSDLAVCCDLSMATVRCALYSVRANLSDVKDAADRKRIESAASQLLTRATKLIQEISPRIWARHEQNS